MKKFINLALQGLCLPLAADVIDQVEHGYLEKEGQFQILHMYGTPYERGFAHGTLLQELIQANVHAFLGDNLDQENPQVAAFRKKLPDLLLHVSEDLLEEMRGVAEGSHIALDKIITLNLFPEMFHCIGITACDEASEDAELYHVRVLDYNAVKGLEKSAVVMVFEGSDIHPFVSCSYAGFIGVFTGMNAEKLSIGEIGGKGYGNYQGMPMAFLLRNVLEKASTLEEAKDVLVKTPRTCEYYYLVSDGKNKTSFGCYATMSQIHFIYPGDNYALFALPNLPDNYETDGYNDKFFLLNPKVKTSPYQTIFEQDNQVVGQIFHQLPKTLSIIGYSNPVRYEPLMKRLHENYGRLNPANLMELIKIPVTCDANLHNAIFVPASLELYFSHADDKLSASDKPYQQFSLTKLLEHAPEIP